MRNVARCWAYETSLLTGLDIPDELPYNDYFEYYGPDYRLHITPSNMENLNDRKYLDVVSVSEEGEEKEAACARGGAPTARLPCAAPPHDRPRPRRGRAERSDPDGPGAVADGAAHAP